MGRNKRNRRNKHNKRNKRNKRNRGVTPVTVLRFCYGFVTVWVVGTLEVVKAQG